MPGDGSPSASGAGVFPWPYSFREGVVDGLAVGVRVRDSAKPSLIHWDEPSHKGSSYTGRCRRPQVNRSSDCFVLRVNSRNTGAAEQIDQGPEPPPKTQGYFGADVRHQLPYAAVSLGMKIRQVSGRNDSFNLPQKAPKLTIRFCVFHAPSPNRACNPRTTRHCPVDSIQAGHHTGIGRREDGPRPLRAPQHRAGLHAPHRRRAHPS